MILLYASLFKYELPAASADATRSTGKKAPEKPKVTTGKTSTTKFSNRGKPVSTQVEGGYDDI